MYRSREDGAASGNAYLGTLANGLAVVEALVGRKLRLRELAETVGLPRQTTYRLVHTLIETGWLVRDSDDAYSLSLHVWSLGVRSFGLTDLRRTLSPAVRSLSERFGETVHLAVYERGLVTYIEKEEGSHPIRSYTELAGRAPAYCVATGKALLAYQDELEVSAVVSGELQAFTPQTITDKKALVAELAETRQRGFAINRGEWREGVAGFAVPILSPAGEAIAGLGFSGPADRILPQQDTLVAALREAARIGTAGPAENGAGEAAAGSAIPNEPWRD